ncbi:MAG: secretin N-terminal domain-containing protein, partial [Phycisphaerales bacterium]
MPSVLSPVAKQLIATFDQESARSSMDVQVFKLTSGDAVSAADAVKAALAAAAKPGEPAPTVTAEKASNTVVIAATPDGIRRASEMIKSMDQTVAPDGIGVRTLLLKNARAESIAPVLENVLKRDSMIEKLPIWARVDAMARAGEEMPVKVAAETRLNAVVISGPNAVLEVAEQLVNELDVAAAGAGESGRSVRVIALQNADATQLATSLEAVFKDEASEAPPTIRVDVQSNALIVRASSEQMRMIDELTAKLDSATLSTNRQMRMVSLDKSKTDANEMAEALRRILRQQSGVKVQVISVEDLMKETDGDDDGDKPSGGGGSRPERAPTHDVGSIGALPNLPGSTHSPFLNLTLVAIAQPGDQPEPEVEDGVTIAVDPATNSLMIVGSPRMTERLSKIASELQSQMPTEPVGVKIVNVPANMDVGAITELVKQTVVQVGRAGPQNPGGFSGPVSVMPDPSGAALVVLANDADFDTVAKIIASVSQVDGAGEMTVKFYPLANTTAQKAIEAVRDLFSAEPRGAQVKRVRAMEVSLTGPEGAISGRIDPARVRLASNPGGTSMIVAAPKDAIPLIDKLVESIDQSPVKDRLSIRRYSLANAKSDELSKTLQSLFDAQRQGAAAQDLPQAKFIADIRTNSMLVTASEAQHEEVGRLLANADSPAEDPSLKLAIIPLQQATPSTVKRLVEEVVIGRDPAKKDKVRISAEDGSNLLVVRAAEDAIEQIRSLVSQVDSSETTGLPIRSIKLEKADALVVAQAMQKFFNDRAQISSRPGQRAVNRVAVIGDRRSGSVLVAASDDDFEQVESLAKQFDVETPSRGFEFKVISLKNARVADIAANVRDVVQEFKAGDAAGGTPSPSYVESNERT